MNISAPFIRRPIATALLMAGLLLGGLVSYRLLPVAALPNVNYPTIQITAQLPGADPQTMASSVATPLEQQLSQIPGLTQLTSTSALGVTTLSAQFELSRTVDSAATDVLAAINAASPYLPVGIPYPPTIRMDQVSASSPDAAVTEGKEELVVKGKKIATEWVEAVTKSGDDVWREKTWTAQEIPGGIIKETLVHERGGKVVSESILELVDFKLGS